MGISVGIDLGTTFSAVAKINETTGKPEIIKNSFGKNITPSVLCFEEDGNVLFGEDAKSMQASGDINTIAFFKRNMGNEVFNVEFFGKVYSATDLSAILLEKLVKEAEANVGEKIESAVITVPAYFTHKERQATIDAGKKAGLNVLAIINEPTAAALAYGLKDKNSEQTILIYDLGGGTFDVTIARITNDKIDILGSDGNHELGGKDWDDCIARYLADKFYEEYNIDLSEEEEMINSLLVIAENVKKQLTSKEEVNVPIIYKNIHTNIKITEKLFEEISSFLLNSTKDLTNNLISSIGLRWNDITGVILVGGSTRMRMVHNFVREMSGKEPLFGVNVDEAVALGAAIKANIAENENRINSSILGKVDARRNFKISGAKKVSDVTAHALGMIAISTDGERYINSIIIPKNTSIPAENTKSYKFKTHSNNNELEIYVLQGDYERPLDNIVINKYIITEIERTSQNPSVIDVTYKYNSNGVVDVIAFQKEINKQLPIRIENIEDDMSWTDFSPKENHIPSKSEIILAIDLSGSMQGYPLKKAKSAMKDFVKQMSSEYIKIGLIAFADETKIITKPSNDFRKLNSAIDGMKIGKVGICNGAEPFSLAKATFDENILKYIVVLTDGVWDKQKYAIERAKDCHENGIEVIALGFGSADYNFLKKIASIEDFAALTDLKDLSGSFSKIAQVIGEGTKFGIKKLK